MNICRTGKDESIYIYERLQRMCRSTFIKTVDYITALTFIHIRIRNMTNHVILRVYYHYYRSDWTNLDHNHNPLHLSTIKIRGRNLFCSFADLYS